MITSIQINGFRSLLGFSIDLEPGLNVLVGSNGTGKSNFISFMDFLGEFAQSGLNSAISVAQGAGAVFSRESFSKDAADLEFTIKGVASGKNRSGVIFGIEDDKPQLDVNYTYSVIIRYIKSVPAVYVAAETLSLSRENDPELVIDRATDLRDGEFSSHVTMNPANHRYAKQAFRWRKGEDTTDEDYLSAAVRPDAALFQLLMGEVIAVTPVMLDLTQYRSVNIDPAVARRSSPVGSSSELGPTGDGLAGVLYRLERGSYFNFNIATFARPPITSADQKSKFRSIMSWCREVNSSIERVQVDLDFAEALLKPSVKLTFSNETYGFNRISDGTVKWIALTTSLFVGSSSSIIEEPENFLHPFMQEVFVSLCREVVSSEIGRSIIVSTHSPTVLDCCDASELRIFDLDNGKTRASLVANRGQLAEKVSNSRFGLGYYYKTGGVYGEDRGDGGGAHGDAFHHKRLR